MIPLQARVAQRLGRGIALLFHDRGTRRGWVVSSTPRPYFTPGKDPVPILQEVGCAPGPVWTGGKSRPHRDSIPDLPAHSQSLYRLSYPAHDLGWGMSNRSLCCKVRRSLWYCVSRKELCRQLVAHGEVLSLRSIELSPYTVELSVLVCTRIPICLFESHLNRKVNRIYRPCI